LLADDLTQSLRHQELEMRVRQKLAEAHRAPDSVNDAEIRDLILTMIQYEEDDLRNNRLAVEQADRDIAIFPSAAAVGSFFCLLMTILLMSVSFATAKSAHRQSLEKERRFRAVVENGADAFVLFRAKHNADGGLTGFAPSYLNVNAKRMLAGID